VMGVDFRVGAIRFARRLKQIPRCARDDMLFYLVSQKCEGRALTQWD
jgi:hypothetical protein